MTAPRAQGETTQEAAASWDDLRLVAALQRGDEGAFAVLLDRYYSLMVRVAMLYVQSRAIAEEVTQEAWLGVLQGLHRFEGRSSLKTWIFRILTNCAKTRAQREKRSIPFSRLAKIEAQPGEPAVDPARFLPDDHPRAPHHWVSFPQNWNELPEAHLLSDETFVYIQQAIHALPPAQRAVITLRDIEGWSSEEVCTILGIGQTNQRVLLHRARSRVRRVLEDYLAEGATSDGA